MLNIEIDGMSAGGGASGLNISAGASTVTGLVIANFGSQSSGSGGNGIVLSSTGGNLDHWQFYWYRRQRLRGRWYRRR